MNKFFALIFLSLFLVSLLNAKTQYMITLKGGTKIKAESFIKKDGVIKVFKYGGYIIYPLKNIKSITKIAPTSSKNYDNIMLSAEGNKKDNVTDKNKEKKSTVKLCNPVVKKIESLPVYSKEKNGFNLNLRGEIDNQCPDFIKNLYITVIYYNEKNEVLFTHKEFLNKISPYDSLKFSKIIKYSDVSKIKYFNYKLEFTKE